MPIKRCKTLLKLTNTVEAVYRVQLLVSSSRTIQSRKQAIFRQFKTSIEREMLGSVLSERVSRVRKETLQNCTIATAEALFQSIDIVRLDFNINKCTLEIQYFYFYSIRKTLDRLQRAARLPLAVWLGKERVLLKLFGTKINFSNPNGIDFAKNNIRTQFTLGYRFAKVWNLISFFLLHAILPFSQHFFFLLVFSFHFRPPKAFNHSSRKNVHISGSVEGILKERNSPPAYASCFMCKNVCRDGKLYCMESSQLYSQWGFFAIQLVRIPKLS